MSSPVPARCLSLFSYLIGDETTGRPSWSTRSATSSEYLAEPTRSASRIEHVIETHFHADFLSGPPRARRRHRRRRSPTATARRPTSRSKRSPTASASSLGEVILEVRATPGHTPESISLVVCEHPDAEPVGRAHRRHAVHRRRRPSRSARLDRVDARAARPAALPIAARPAPHLARLDTRLPRARRRLRVRQATSRPRSQSTIGEQRAHQLRARADDAKTPSSRR